MKEKHKIWSQRIPITLEEAWAFFSRPENLNTITPADFKIRLREDISSQELARNMEIHYDLSPMIGLRLHWVTRITELKKPNYFIYEQKKGPYRSWVHEHYFKEVEGGIVMTDKLSYSLRWGRLGRWIDQWIVDDRIDRIFRYRAEKVKEMFGGELDEES